MWKIPQGKKQFRAAKLEIRAGGDDAGRKIAGHAAVFKSPSVEMYGFTEVIEPGAFANTIKRDDIRALWNHNPDLVLGRNTAGTLSLEEDKQGLAIEIDAPDTQAGRDAIVSIRRGDVSGMSFGFMVKEQTIEEKEGGDVVIRHLEEVELFEVSPVAFPAYPETDVAVRSFLGRRESELEAIRRALVKDELEVELTESDREELEGEIRRLAALCPDLAIWKRSKDSASLTYTMPGEGDAIFELEREGEEPAARSRIRLAERRQSLAELKI